MSFKKLFIILSITFGVISLLMLGVSYAWYAYSNAESTLIGRALQEKPTVIFAQDENIVLRTNTPIIDDDRYSFANITSFNITFGENLVNYETSIYIDLDEIVIDNELINNNFKYELLENGKTVARGSFIEYQNNGMLHLMPVKIINEDSYPKTYVYDLLIWLSDDGTSQNDLMDKNFKAKVKVNNAMKRK